MVLSLPPVKAHCVLLSALGAEGGASLPVCLFPSPPALGKIQPGGQGRRCLWFPTCVFSPHFLSHLHLLITSYLTQCWFSSLCPPRYRQVESWRKEALPAIGTSFCASRGARGKVEEGYFGCVFESTYLYTFLGSRIPTLPSVPHPIPLPAWFFNCLNYVSKKKKGKKRLLVPQTSSLETFVEKSFFWEPLTWPLWLALSTASWPWRQESQTGHQAPGSFPEPLSL